MSEEILKEFRKANHLFGFAFSKKEQIGSGNVEDKPTKLSKSDKP
jgi:hypothetical protein